MWDWAGLPWENPHVQAGERHTLSHTITVDHGEQNLRAAVKSECIFTMLLLAHLDLINENGQQLSY